MRSTHNAQREEGIDELVRLVRALKDSSLEAFVMLQDIQEYNGTYCYLLYIQVKGLLVIIEQYSLAGLEVCLYVILIFRYTYYSLYDMQMAVVFDPTMFYFCSIACMCTMIYSCLDHHEGDDRKGGLSAES